MEGSPGHDDSNVSNADCYAFDAFFSVGAPIDFCCRAAFSAVHFQAAGDNCHRSSPWGEFFVELPTFVPLPAVDLLNNAAESSVASVASMDLN